MASSSRETSSLCFSHGLWDTVLQPPIVWLPQSQAAIAAAQSSHHSPALCASNARVRAMYVLAFSPDRCCKFSSSLRARCSRTGDSNAVRSNSFSSARCQDGDVPLPRSSASHQIAACCRGAVKLCTPLLVVHQAARTPGNHQLGAARPLHPDLCRQKMVVALWA